jgi:hypothetical protein
MYSQILADLFVQFSEFCFTFTDLGGKELRVRERKNRKKKKEKRGGLAQGI